MADDSLILYHNPLSRGRIAHWMIEETGAPYTVKLISFERGEHKQPEFLQINPMGKIPTLVHHGTVITEAAAVCSYLADAFPAANLAPPVNDVARGTYYRWLFFGAGCIEPALFDKLYNRPPPERKGALGYGSYEETLNALEMALQPGPYILGDRFSAADVYVGSEIAWGLMSKGLEPRPIFLKYIEQFRSRPAYQRSNAKNEAYLQQLKAEGR